MNEQEQPAKKQHMVTGSHMGELQRRVNAKLDNGFWRIVPGSIGCGHAEHTFRVIGGEKTETSAHFWAVVEQVDAPAPDAALLDAAKDAYGDISMFLSGEWDGEQLGGWEQTLAALRAAITQAETTK